MTKEGEMGGKRIRNEEIRLIAQYIRCQRHSDELICNDDSYCNVKAPKKNWAKAFLDRQAARGVGTRGDKSAVNNHQKIDPWLPDLNKRLHPTKILNENVYHLVTVGGAMPYHADPQKLVTIDDLREFEKRQHSAPVVTIVECVSRSDKLLSPLIVWPKSILNDSLDEAKSFHFANLVLTGRFEETAFFHWLQHVFEPQTCVRADRRKRFLLIARTERFCLESIQKFCREKDIVLCDAHGAPWKNVLPDVSLHASRIPSIVETLQQVYTNNRTSGMRFLEGYSVARTQAFRTHDKVSDPALVPTPVKHGNDHADDNELDSASDIAMPTANAFEQLVFEVQHDLACLDIDREERELIDHFISTAKAFASFYFDHSATDL